MSATSPATTPQASARRLDIEGLRAVAILLVLVYHAGVPWLTGGFIGVDVFFVISGFLITGLLVREIESTGRVSLPRFYARRAKRLLPATVLVIITTAALTWATVSQVHWRTFGWDLVSSAGYVINWRLADRSVDYLAEDVGASPVQHFWSLAVEEQFYIVWPLLLVALAWWLRRRPRARVRVVLLVGLLAVVLPSLAYSIHLTSTDPTVAFFVTPTRLWELGIGGLVAIGSQAWPRIPKRPAIALGWTGLAVVIVGGFTLTSATPWPSAWAAIPTLGTAAVIIAGFAAGPRGPARVLSTAPAVWIGAISYSLYLWHWPLLVSAKAQFGDLSLPVTVAIAAFAIVPAWLSLRLIEDPFRHAKSLSRSSAMALSVGANAMLVGAIAGLALVVVATSSASQGSADAPGAQVLQGSAAGPGTVASLSQITSFTPDAAAAPEDLPQGYADDCQVAQDSAELRTCEWGDPEGDTTVVAVGDSKLLQWQSAIDEIAKEEGWRVISYTKSACGFHAGVERAGDRPYTECTQWNSALADEILRLEPDAVITDQGSGMALSSPDDTSTDDRQAMVDALTTRWSQLQDAGITVIPILDNPHPDTTVYECVADHQDDLSACTFDREQGLEDSAAPAQLAAAKELDITPLDLNDSICPEKTCVPVIGGVLVYRQTSHVTDTYVRTMIPEVRSGLVPLVDGSSG
ncbi:MAG: acyltransferase [Janibacter sp.]|nr:acyltransferase [Janibacter sp.]